MRLDSVDSITTTTITTNLGQPHMVLVFQVHIKISNIRKINKKAVLPQGNRAMPQVFFSVEVRQQHSLQV